MKMNVCRSVAFVFVLAFVLASGSTALAQGVATGSIAGVVKDTSGGILPGVTVEARSPALIERSRSAITDDQGAYKLVDLRPGTYSVAFTLSGFATLRREGLELTSNFTAPLSIELKVGALEETVTVSGLSPVVDTQNTVQQRVFAKAIIEALPVGQSVAAYTALIPGATGTAADQDVGGTKGENTQGFRIHGSRGADFQQLRDGMNFAHEGRAGNVLSSTNPAAVQEVGVETSGYSAEAETVGGHVNIIPRDGGNVFNGSSKEEFTHDRLQGNNITDDLSKRGAKDPNHIRRIYEVGGGFGGPVKRDKLWYFASLHYWQTSTFLAGNYFNRLQAGGPLNTPQSGTSAYTPFYEADLSRPAYDWNYYPEIGIRGTWQAAAKHKFTIAYANEAVCNCFWNIGSGTLAPEATGDDAYKPNWRLQSTWTFPVTSRLLLWAGYTNVYGFGVRQFTGGYYDQYSILDDDKGYRYGSSGSGTGITTSWGREGDGRHTLFAQQNANFRMQYVTGSHAFKVGLSAKRIPKDQYSRIKDGMAFVFGTVNGVYQPKTLVVWATPFTLQNSSVNSTIFAQDQWTMKRLTLNLGLRYDAMTGSVPEQHVPAGPWVPQRDFLGREDAPNWKDINPRLGVSYDLRGSGKTAVKFALGRYVNYDTGGITSNLNPVNSMVVSATRAWTDSNGDYLPQENELGALSNSAFGTVQQNTTYDDRVVRGWGRRGYSWQSSVSVQHELMPGVGVEVGYFRTWFGNFTVTDNTLIGPANYDEFCITAPVNARLPNSGQQICGLYDLKRNPNGTTNNSVQNLVRPASDFGTGKDVFNGIDVTLNARLQHGIVVAGGVAAGSQMRDYCFVVDSPGTVFIPNVSTATPEPQRRDHCHVAPPWSALMQVKLSAVVPLPYKFQAAVNWQSLPPIPTTATYNASSTVVQWVDPSVRTGNLNACRAATGACTSTAAIELIAPNMYYTEPRNNQVDVRFTRTFRMGRTSVQPQLSAYNLFNVGSVLAMRTAYGNGTGWQDAQAVLGPRLLKVGFQVNF